MRLLDRMRRQTCVYWEYVGFDNQNKPRFAAPRELRVRWVESTEVFLNRQNQEQVSRAKVYVGEDVVEESVLRLGGLEDVTNLDKPLKNDKAWQVARFDKVPTLEADDFKRVAYL